MGLLLTHPWRGKVRELVNVIERALLASTRTMITAATLAFLKQPFITTENPSFNPVSINYPVNTPTNNNNHTTTPAATSSPENLMALSPLKTAVRNFEKQFIENAMLAANGHVIKASRMLQIDRTTLWKKAKELGIDLHPQDEM